jgi:hypothetical protein
MAKRPAHPNKEIEAVVAYAEAKGWSWTRVSGHAWGKLYCAHHDRDGCKVFVWSTPRSPQNHAKDLKRDIDRCVHQGQQDR